MYLWTLLYTFFLLFIFTAPIQAGRLVKVGIYQNKPLVFMDSHEKAKGIYIDLIEYIAKREKWQIKYVPGKFEKCLNRLKKGEIDLLPGIAYSKDREKEYDFNQQTILTNWGRVYSRNDANYQSILDLKNKSVAALEGDIYLKNFQSLLQSFNIECAFITVDEYANVFQLVDKKETDVALISRLYGLIHAKDYKVKQTPIVFSPNELRFALPEGQNLNLSEAIDYYLIRFKRYPDSIYYQSLQSWIGNLSKPVFPDWIIWTLCIIGGLTLLFLIDSIVLKIQVKNKTQALEKEIIERKKSEEELKKGRKEFKESLESLQEFFIKIDTDFVVQLNNRASAEMYNVPLNFVGRYCYDVFWDTDKVCSGCAAKKAMETKIKTKGIRYHPNGRIFERTVYPIFDGGGQVSGAIILGTDITDRKLAERALRESEERHRTTLDSIGDAVIATDTKGNVNRINPVAAKLTGWNVDEARGRPLTEIFHIVNSHTGERVEDPVGKVLENGEIIGLTNDTKLISKAGQEYQIADSAAPIKDDEGNLIGVVLVFHDVTEQYRLQKNLRKSKKFLHNIFDGIQDGLSVLDLDLNIVQVNKWVEEMYSHKMPLIGKKCYEAYQDRKSVCPFCPSVKSLETGEKNTIEAPYPDEKDPQGWILLTSYPMTNDRGEITGIIESVKDITKRKQSEEELRDSEKRFRELTELLPQPIWETDLKGNFIYTNRAGYDVFGYTEDDLQSGVSIDNVIATSDRGRALTNFKKVLHGECFSDHEYTCSTSEGVDFPALIYSCPILKNGKLSGLRGITIDISWQKRTEEALRKSEEKYKKERNFLDNLFENSADAIGIVDQKGKFIRWNKKAAEIFGYSFEQMQGKHFSEAYADSNDMEQMLTKLRKNGFIQDYEIDFIKKDRTLFPCSISISLLRDNNHKTIGSISILRDLTEWKEAQRKLKELSLYDALTGLYNRTFFEEEMKRLSNGRYCPMGIIMCDINGLKLINDTKGHEKGDELLKLAAEIFKRCFRASDIIARIGGDEFAILLPESNQEIVSTCSNRIRQEVRNYNKNDLELGLSISIGSSVKFYPPVDMNKLFKEADDAMYKEKLQQNFSSRSETALALIKTMEARDYITNGHAKRLQDYAQQLGRTLRLSEQRLNDLKLLGRFHDLGKVGVPDRILFKSGPLNKEEFNEMKRHCEIGHRIALSLSDLAPIADFILKHHEWWNGQGYPLGLKGKEIPLESRIIAIVDAYDTMTSERPYKAARSQQEAVEELRQFAGTQFDPDLVEKFIEILEKAKHKRNRVSFFKN